MADIIDRLETTMRPFERAVFYGAGGFTHALTEKCGVGHVFESDFTAARLNGNGFVGDEELWPIGYQSIDLAVSLLTLHHANDLVGALTQIRHSLKPDGLFIAALFGENTMRSLRDALYQAETEITGGVSARVAPFASVRDLGGAMQRAGFAMPVADIDNARVQYKNPIRLFEDLRAMGETNVLVNRGGPMTRTLLSRTMEILANADDPAAFDIVYLTGWAPHHNQPKPLAPGSAKTSLAQAVLKEEQKP